MCKCASTGICSAIPAGPSHCAGAKRIRMQYADVIFAAKSTTFAHQSHEMPGTGLWRIVIEHVTKFVLVGRIAGIPARLCHVDAVAPDHRANSVGIERLEQIEKEDFTSPDPLVAEMREKHRDRIGHFTPQKTVADSGDGMGRDFGASQSKTPSDAHPYACHADRETRGTFRESINSVLWCIALLLLRSRADELGIRSSETRHRLGPAQPPRWHRGKSRTGSSNCRATRSTSGRSKRKDTAIHRHHGPME